MLTDEPAVLVESLEVRSLGQRSPSTVVFAVLEEKRKHSFHRDHNASKIISSSLSIILLLSSPFFFLNYFVISNVVGVPAHLTVDNLYIITFKVLRWNVPFLLEWKKSMRNLSWQNFKKCCQCLFFTVKFLVL